MPCLDCMSKTASGRRRRVQLRCSSFSCASLPKVHSAQGADSGEQASSALAIVLTIGYSAELLAIRRLSNPPRRAAP
jgi:hypothetical protein